MAVVSINTLWNASIYVGGIGYIGAAGEISVPQPIRKMADYKGLGMIGEVPLPVGWERMESRIRWVSFNGAIITSLLSAFTVIPIQAMGDVQIISSSGQIQEGSAIFNMTGMFSDPGEVGLRAQENAEFESTFLPYHVELIYLGLPVYVFDSLANTYTIAGVDQLANYNNNIGA